MPAKGENKGNKGSKLLPRQALFVREYLVDLNGKQAAIRAGYSAKTAEFTASRMLSSGKVQEAVQKAMNKRAEKIDITAERVLAEIAKLGFANMEDYVDPEENGAAKVNLGKINRDQWAAVQEITTEELGRGEGCVVIKTRFKLADKKGSLELLGRHLKLFVDRAELTGKDGGPIETRDVKQLTRDELMQIASKGN